MQPISKLVEEKSMYVETFRRFHVNVQMRKGCMKHEGKLSN